MSRAERFKHKPQGLTVNAGLLTLSRTRDIQRLNPVLFSPLNNASGLANVREVEHKQILSHAAGNFDCKCRSPAWAPVCQYQCPVGIAHVPLSPLGIIFGRRFLKRIERGYRPILSQPSARAPSAWTPSTATS